MVRLAHPTGSKRTLVATLLAERICRVEINPNPFERWIDLKRKWDGLATYPTHLHPVLVIMLPILLVESDGVCKPFFPGSMFCGLLWIVSLFCYLINLSTKINDKSIAI
jgi:hypothetical protein